MASWISKAFQIWSMRHIIGIVNKTYVLKLIFLKVISCFDFSLLSLRLAAFNCLSMPLLWRKCALKWGNFFFTTSRQRWLTADFLNHKVFSSIPEKGPKEFDGIYHQHSMNSLFLNYFANFHFSARPWTLQCDRLLYSDRSWLFIIVDQNVIYLLYAALW